MNFSGVDALLLGGRSKKIREHISTENRKNKEINKLVKPTLDDIFPATSLHVLISHNLPKQIHQLGIKCLNA